MVSVRMSMLYKFAAKISIDDDDDNDDGLSNCMMFELTMESICFD